MSPNGIIFVSGTVKSGPKLFFLTSRWRKEVPIPGEKEKKSIPQRLRRKFRKAPNH